MYDASDIHPAVDFANAKHQPSARRVGKGRNRFVGILRYAAQRFLALEVVFHLKPQTLVSKSFRFMLLLDHDDKRCDW